MHGVGRQELGQGQVRRAAVSGRAAIAFSKSCDGLDLLRLELGRAAAAPTSGAAATAAGGGVGSGAVSAFFAQTRALVVQRSGSSGL